MWIGKEDEGENYGSQGKSRGTGGCGVCRHRLGRSEARVVLAGSQLDEAGRRRTGAQARSGGSLVTSVTQISTGGKGFSSESVESVYRRTQLRNARTVEGGSYFDAPSVCEGSCEP